MGLHPYTDSDSLVNKGPKWCTWNEAYIGLSFLYNPDIATFFSTVCTGIMANSKTDNSFEVSSDSTLNYLCDMPVVVDVVLHSLCLSVFKLICTVKNGVATHTRTVWFLYMFRQLLCTLVCNTASIFYIFNVATISFVGHLTYGVLPYAWYFNIFVNGWKLVKLMNHKNSALTILLIALETSVLLQWAIVIIRYVLLWLFYIKIWGLHTAAHI